MLHATASPWHPSLQFTANCFIVLLCLFQQMWFAVAQVQTTVQQEGRETWWWWWRGDGSWIPHHKTWQLPSRIVHCRRSCSVSVFSPRALHILSFQSNKPHQTHVNPNHAAHVLCSYKDQSRQEGGCTVKAYKSEILGCSQASCGSNQIQIRLRAECIRVKLKHDIGTPRASPLWVHLSNAPPTAPPCGCILLYCGFYLFLPPFN